MDLNYILEWFVGVTSVAGLVRILRSPTHGRTGWIVTFSIDLAILVAGFIFFPIASGYAAAAFWCVFVLGPSLVFRIVQRAVFRQQFEIARKAAMVARVLHPADGLREYPELLRSFELGRQGRFEEAEQVLMRYESKPGWIGNTAGLYVKRLRGDWDAIREWCGRLPEASLIRSVDALTLYLRSLGETGQLNEMVQSFGKYRKTLARLPRSMRDLARLYVYSFSGKTDLVERLFTGSLRLYPRDIRELWLGTSQLAAGNEDEGRRRLEQLRSEGDPLTRTAVDRRLAQPPRQASRELIPPSVKILEDDLQAFEHEERFDAASRPAGRTAITYALIAVCAIVFAAETMLGGATDGRTLWRMGAMMPSLVLQGEWWRILAAQFLHYGWIHLVMNMLALYLLGPFVERELGKFRYLLVYLLSGAGAMMTIIALTRYGILQDDFVVGASGSILGLIGASAAILLQGWVRHRAAVARRRLISIGLILLLQALFDLTTPQISFTAHLSGAVFGFLIAAMMIRNAGDPAAR